MKKIALILFVAVLATSALPGWADSPAMVVLDIRGVDALNRDIAKISGAIGLPMTPEMMTLVANSTIGAPTGAGLTSGGKWRLIARANAMGDYRQTVALVLPVSDGGETYLAGLSNAGWIEKEKRDDGIRCFRPVGGALAGDGKQTIFVQPYGPQSLLMAFSTEALSFAHAALPGLPNVLPVEGKLALQIRPVPILDEFEPILHSQFTNLTQCAISNGNSDASAALVPNAETMGPLFQMCLDSSRTLLRQWNSFTLGFGVFNGYIDVCLCGEPADGSLTETWVASIQTPSAETAIVNLPNAYAIEQGHFGDISLWMPAIEQWMRRLVDVVPAHYKVGKEALIEEYIASHIGFCRQASGDFGNAYMSDNRQVQFVGLKDAAEARTQLMRCIAVGQDVLKRVLAWGSAQDPEHPIPAIAIDFKQNVRDVEGHPVDQLTLRLQKSDHEPLATLFEQCLRMWGGVASQDRVPEEAVFEIAWLPNGLLGCNAGAATTDQLVRKVLSADFGAPVSARSEWRAAFPTPSPTLKDMQICDLFACLRETATDDGTGSLRDFIPEGQGPLSGCAYTLDGNYIGCIRCSLEDVALIVQAIQKSRQFQIANAKTDLLAEEDESEADGMEEAALTSEPKAPAIDGAVVGEWTMDYAAAQTLAREKGLPMLLNFTGSDWCGWCKLMDRNVFSTTEWREWAAQNIVLVWIDFPRDSSLVPEKYVERNQALASQFGVRGYPTYMILSPEGRTLGKLGASQDIHARVFIQRLRDVLAKASSER